MLVVAILKGGFVFAADLIRALNRAGMRPQVDFMTLASDGDGAESSGKITIAGDISDDVRGRDVLLVGDILESGRTACDADFCGFVAPDRFVVGYGLDDGHFYRDLPNIGTVEAG